MIKLKFNGGNVFMKKILCAILCAILALSLCACGGTTQDATEGTDAAPAELEKITVVLDWTPNTNHSGLYAAVKNGYYEEAGLDVEIKQPGESSAEALVAGGKAQFGISFQDTMAAALAADEPLDIKAVAAVVQHNLSGIISRKDKGIDSFAKMAGHTYATWGNPIEQAIIKNCIENDGGSFEELDMVDTSVLDVMAALDTDMVDTVWVYEYWDVVNAQVAGYDYNYIDFKNANETFDYYTPVIIASGEYIESDGETVDKFLAATKKGYEFCAQNPAEAADILLEAAPELDGALVKASAEFMADKYVDENGEWGEIDPERWQRFYDWLYENSLTNVSLGNAGLDASHLKWA